MKLQRYLMGIFASALAAGLAVPAVQAEETSAPVVKTSAGTIVGIIRNSANLPIAGATVTAARADGGIRATVSSSDGIYSFADLPPGAWSLTVQIDGYPDVTGLSLEVISSKATRHDIVMNAPGLTPSAPALAAEAAIAAKVARNRVIAAAPAVPSVPEALQAPDPAPENDTYTPLANVGDIGWIDRKSVV